MKELANEDFQILGENLKRIATPECDPLDGPIFEPISTEMTIFTRKIRISDGSGDPENGQLSEPIFSAIF